MYRKETTLDSPQFIKEPNLKVNFIHVYKCDRMNQPEGG